jgi:hypothetical protein
MLSWNLVLVTENPVPRKHQKSGSARRRRQRSEKFAANHGEAPSRAQIPRGRGGIPPTLQVGPSCEAAGRGAVVLGRNKEACLADETTAQDTLTQNWSKYSATDRTECVGMVTTGGPASYVELLSCVEILRDARNIRNADALESDNESVSMRRSRDNRRPVRVRRRHPN